MLVITCPRLRSDSCISILWKGSLYMGRGEAYAKFPCRSSIFSSSDHQGPPKKKGKKPKEGQISTLSSLVSLVFMLFIRRPLVFLLALSGPNVYFFLFALTLPVFSVECAVYLNGPEWPDRSGRSVMIVLLDFYSCHTFQSLGDLFCEKPLLNRTGVTGPEWPECDDCTF